MANEVERSEDEMTKAYEILNTEAGNKPPYAVFWKRDGKTVRAEHLGRKGYFKSYAEAQQAVHNAEHYGTQNV